MPCCHPERSIAAGDAQSKDLYTCIFRAKQQKTDSIDPVRCTCSCSPYFPFPIQSITRPQSSYRQIVSAFFLLMTFLSSQRTS